MRPHRAAVNTKAETECSLQAAACDELTEQQSTAAETKCSLRQQPAMRHRAAVNTRLKQSAHFRAACATSVTQAANGSRLESKVLSLKAEL
jgi:hypothetical protein